MAKQESDSQRVPKGTEGKPQTAVEHLPPGWYPRRRGILEHLESGLISLLDSAVHDLLCLTCDHRTGLAWSSAKKIQLLAPRDLNERAVRRSLENLERLGWIK